MTPSRPETILNDPLFEGRVLHVWREAGWERWRIEPRGGLTPVTGEPDSALHSWRTPTAA